MMHHLARAAFRAAPAPLLAAVAVLACGDRGRTPAGLGNLVIPVFTHAAGQDGGQFGTHMTGAEETPPRPSRAQGQLTLRFSADGTRLYTAEPAPLNHADCNGLVCVSGT